jgi:hypothetical protein
MWTLGVFYVPQLRQVNGLHTLKINQVIHGTRGINPIGLILPNRLAFIIRENNGTRNSCH